MQKLIFGGNASDTSICRGYYYIGIVGEGGRLWFSESKANLTYFNFDLVRMSLGRAGLPDFSWYMVPKPEKMYQISKKRIQWA
jgi:hypothetical protein